MKIFALDSSGVCASVALCDDQKTLYSKTINEGLTHSETLLPLTEQAFEKTSLKPDDIELFAVSAGPGSFTGLRIGIGLVKGLAFKNNSPCVAVSTLEALAHQASDGNDGTFVSLIDAKNKRFYCGAFEIKNGECFELFEQKLLLAAEVLENILKLQKTVTVCGDGKNVFLKLFESEITQKGDILISDSQNDIDAVTVAKLGFLAYKNGEAVESFMLKPRYLELSQAERNLVK